MISILKYVKQLEYDRIIADVCELAVSDEGRSKIISLVPSCDISVVSEQLEKTEALRELLTEKNYPNISSVSGIPEIAVRAKKGGLLSMAEMLKVKTMLKNAEILALWYSKQNGKLVTDELFFRLYEDNELEHRINESILSENEMGDAASSQLRDIRKQIIRAENSVRDRLNDVLKSSETKKYLQDSIVTMRGGRFVVPVRAENRAAVKGLVHDISQSGSTYFIEPEAVVEANNRIMELKGEEAREIEKILAGFTLRVAEIAERLTDSYHSFISLDVLIAKAKYAVMTDSCKPLINDNGYIKLKKARHPLIPKQMIVPVDISLGGEYDILVITGPNTGGKTVALKTVGLLTLMTMAGLLIPVSEGSEVGIFDMILADIGDEQSIEQNLSTFSGHMSNISGILKSAGARSLVLLDELGAGTDPAEGAALAVAILDRMIILGCKVVATTHFGEIKIYAMETPRVENASCEFDVKSLKPTYRLMIGIPGTSNALVIAENLGIDAELIEEAKRNMDAGNRIFEDALREVERIRDGLAEKEEYAEKNIIIARETLSQAKIEAERVTGEASKEYERARLRSRQMSADVEASARKLIDEIKKLDSEKENNRKRVSARVREIARKDSADLLIQIPEIDKEKYDNLPGLDEIKPGQKAFAVSLGQVAEILSLPDKSGTVEIRAGLVKTRVAADMLKTAPLNTAEKTKKNYTNNDFSGKRTGTNEINLIGLSVEEAVMETERFIDSALLGSFSTIYLIHGKGTGALRSGLQQYLKTQKHVKNFRLGGYGEGESGVTIVELSLVEGR